MSAKLIKLSIYDEPCDDFKVHYQYNTDFRSHFILSQNESKVILYSTELDSIVYEMKKLFERTKNDVNVSQKIDFANGTLEYYSDTQYEFTLTSNHGDNPFVVFTLDHFDRLARISESLIEEI